MCDPFYTRYIAMGFLLMARGNFDFGTPLVSMILPSPRLPESDLWGGGVGLYMRNPMPRRRSLARTAPASPIVPRSLRSASGSPPPDWNPLAPHATTRPHPSSPSPPNKTLGIISETSESDSHSTDGPLADHILKAVNYEHPAFSWGCFVSSIPPFLASFFSVKVSC